MPSSTRHPIRELIDQRSKGTSLLRAARETLSENLDIALFGIPFDGGTLGRTGSRYGPEQVREMSFNIRELNAATRIAPFDICRVADVGDIITNVFDSESALAEISSYCIDVVSRGAIPLAVGGDHSISLPGLRGVASKHGAVAVVHFDAHCDTYDHLDGNRYNHATPFRRAVEEGITDPRHHIMIGIRGTIGTDMEAFDWAEQQGMTILWMDACTRLGVENIVSKVRNIVGEKPVYVTIDIDGIDPTEMRGTCSPEPGGLTMREMQGILRGLRGIDIVGGDVNEISPPLDPSGLTALNAAHLLFELLCLAAENVNDRSRRD